jgi:hypothetical protein
MFTMKQKQALYKAARAIHEADLAHSEAVFYLKGGISAHCEIDSARIASVIGTGNIEPASYSPDGSVATYDVFYWYGYPSK